MTVEELERSRRLAVEDCLAAERERDIAYNESRRYRQALEEILAATTLEETKDIVVRILAPPKPRPGIRSKSMCL